MNILHILDNSYKPDPRVKKELVSLIKSPDIKITLLCKDGVGEKSLEEKIKIIRCLPDNIEQYYKLRNFKIYDLISKQINLDKFKIIHAHDHISLHIASIIKKKHPSLILIFDAHEYIRGWKYYQDGLTFWIRTKGLFVHKIYTFDEHQNIKKYVDSIITVSDGLAKLYSKYNKEVIVIKNTPILEDNLDSINNLDIRKSLNLSDRDIIIVHSGWPYYDKETLKNLFDTFSRIDSNYKLVIVCSVEGFKKLETEYNFKHLVNLNIFHHELVAYVHLNDFLSTADIGLILTYNPKWSSYWNSLPNKIFDYSNAGLALVATNQPEFVKLITQNNNGVYYYPKEEKALEKAITICVKSLSEYKLNSKNNRNKNDWKKEEIKLNNLYEKYINI